MADLQDCYFCGAIEELEQHPIVPAELDPPEDAQHRVVVCPTCRAKLDRVVEPLLAYVDAGSEGSGDPEGGAESPPDEPEKSVTDEPGEIESAPDDGSDESNDGGTAETDGEADEAAGDTDEVDEDADAEADGEDDEPVELPEETGEVIRLLGNREFPVEREEILAVASSAYGVTYEEAEAVVDALIERGQLAEKEGTLYRPE